MTQAALKKRLQYNELAGRNNEAILTTADPDYDNKDGFDKAIEQMELELGYTYPLTEPAAQKWALKRSKRHALQILLNENLMNMQISMSPGSFGLSQVTNQLKREVSDLDAEFARAKEAGKVPFGDDAAERSGFAVTRIAHGYDPKGNLVF